MDIKTLGIEVDSSGIKKAIKDLEDLTASSKKANDNTGKLEGGVKKASNAIDVSANKAQELRQSLNDVGTASTNAGGKLSSAFNGAVNVLGRLPGIAGMGISSIQSIASVAIRASGAIVALGGVVGGALGVAAVGLNAVARPWVEMEKQLKGSGLAASQLLMVQTELARIARDTTTSLNSTAAMYASANMYAQELGLSQGKILQLTEAVNLAFKAGGASAAEASSYALKLADAIGSGVLKGDELRSVLEGAPLIAKAIADEFGVGVGELRKLGEEGQLVSDRVMTALINKSNDFKEAIGDSTMTGAQGLSVMRTGAAELSGELAQLTGRMIKATRVSELLGRVFASVGNAASVAAAKIRNLDAVRAQSLAKTATSGRSAVSLAMSGVNKGSIQSEAGAAITNTFGPTLGLQGQAYFATNDNISQAVNIAATQNAQVMKETESLLNLQLAQLSSGGGGSYSRAVKGIKSGGGSVRAPVYRGGAASSQIKKVANDVKEVNNNLKETKPLMDSAFASGVVRSFVDDLRNGKNAAEALTGVVGKLGDKLIDIAMLQLDGVFSGMFTSAGSKKSGGISTALGALFGGFRAGGGSVSAGKAYITGEQGRELFIPRQNGKIVPISADTRQRSGGGNTTVQIINNTNGNVRTEKQTGANGDEIIRVVIEEVKAAMVDGRFDGSMRAAYGARPLVKSR